MLKISPSQFKMLEDGMKENFESRLHDFIKLEFGQSLPHLGDSQIEAICRHVIKTAEGFGIEEAIPIAQLACLAIGTSGRILVDPVVVEYLSDQSLPPTQRVQLLVDELSGYE